MTAVRLSPAAVVDYDAIIAFLEGQAGWRVAELYERKFEAALDTMASFPGIGAPRPKHGARTRLYVVYPYSIYYDGGAQDKEVHVLRILHGRRRVTRRLISEGRKEE